MAAISCQRVCLFLSLWLLLLRGSRCERASVWTEKELYQSKLWKEESRSLFAVKQDAISQEEYTSIEEQLSDTDIAMIEVSCTSTETSGDVCTALSHHVFAMRPKHSGADNVQGVDVPSEYNGNKIAYLLQMILKDQVNFISSYSELKELFTQHDQLFFAYTVDTINDDFVGLLKLLLSYPIQLVVTTRASALPLTHRPHHTSSPSPLILWCILGSGQQWLQFQNEPSKISVQTEDESEGGKSLRERLEEFVDRLQYPIVVKYSEELSNSLKDSDFHLVYAFPGLVPDESVDINILVQNVAKQAFNDYIFILGKRDTTIANRLFVTADTPEPQVVILPFGIEEEMLNIPVQTNDVSKETDEVIDILNTFRIDNQRTADGQIAPPMVSLLDPMFLTEIINDNEFDVLVAFCELGSEDCPGVPYESMRDAMVALQGSVVKDQLGQLAGHVVECESVEDVRKFKFSTLPCYGVYNHTERKWYRNEGDIERPMTAIELISKATGLEHLPGMIAPYLDNSHETSTSYSSYESIYPALRDDDHFGLLLKTLPTLSLPSEIVLTSSTFDEHIQSYDKTAVIFYTQWCIRSKVFLHHVLAAHERLDQAQDVSVAVVNCADYTDLCSRFRVTTFPTALLFTPSTLDTPSPLTATLSTLDSAHILNALGQHSLGETGDNENEELLELLPSTLPGLLGGDLTTPLVLWCDSHVTSDMGDTFKRVASRSTGLSFAWINSSKYSELLSKMLASDKVTYPTVLAIQFDKHAVYQLPAPGAGAEDQFEDSLQVFLKKLITGHLEPTGKLLQKEWPPLQPPLPYPSREARGEIMGDDDDHSGNVSYRKVLGEDKNGGDSLHVSDDESNSVPPPPHESQHTEL